MPDSTVDLTIPYAVPADPLADWPATNQSMSERIETLLKGMQVVVGAGLTGDGSTATPLTVRTPMSWGGTLEAKPDLDAYGADSTIGAPVYTDSVGDLRSQPMVLPTDKNIQSAATWAYPVGMSVMSVTAASGWPAPGLVVTYRQLGATDATSVAAQYHYTVGADRAARYRIGDPTWQAWQIQTTGTDTGWINIPIQSGYAPQGVEIPQLRMVNGVVHSRGGWSSTGIPINSNKDPVGIVPVGYRPTQNVIWRAGTVNGGVTSEIFIASTGNVSIRSGPVLTYHMLGVSWLTT